MADDQRRGNGDVQIIQEGPRRYRVTTRPDGASHLYVLTAHPDVRVHLEYCVPNDAFVLSLTFAPGVDTQWQAKLTTMALSYAWANLFRLGIVGQEMPSPVRSETMPVRGVQILEIHAQRFLFTAAFPLGRFSELTTEGGGVRVEALRVEGGQEFVIQITGEVEMSMGAMSLYIRSELERIWEILYQSGFASAMQMLEPIRGPMV